MELDLSQLVNLGKFRRDSVSPPPTSETTPNTARSAARWSARGTPRSKSSVALARDLEPAYPGIKPQNLGAQFSSPDEGTDAEKAPGERVGARKKGWALAEVDSLILALKAGQSPLIRSNPNSVFRSFGKHKGKSLRQAFVAWDAVVEQRKKLVDVCGNVTRRWLNQSLAAAFDGWASQAERWMRAKRTLARAVGKWTHSRALGASFETWACEVSAKVFAAAQNKAVRHWRADNAVLRALGAWRDHHSRCVTARIVRRWGGDQKLRRAFLSLADHAAQESGLRRNAVTLARWFSKAGAGRAFNSWLDLHQEATEAKRLAAASLRKWLVGGVVRKAWGKWRGLHAVLQSAVAESEEGRDGRLLTRAFSVWHHETLRMLHGRGALLRWGQTSTGRALAGWAYEVRAQKERERAGLRVAMKRRLFVLSKTVRGWHAYTAESAVEAKRAGGPCLWCLPGFSRARPRAASDTPRSSLDSPTGVLNSPSGVGSVRKGSRSAGRAGGWVAGLFAWGGGKGRGGKFEADAVTFSMRRDEARGAAAPVGGYGV